MELNSTQKKILTDIAQSSYGPRLVELLEGMVFSIADIRKMQDVSDEKIKGRQYALVFIEEILISKLKQYSKASGGADQQDEFV